MSNIINLFDNLFNKSRLPVRNSDTVIPDDTDAQVLSELNILQETIFKINATGKWLLLSNKWTEYTGYTTEECLGKSWLNYIHPKDHSTCQEYIRRVSKGQYDSLAKPIRIITKQNELRWMEMRASILPGNIPNSSQLMGTLTDISAEKSENERQLANYRALYSLVSNIPGMVYRCRYNRDWTMEFVSAGCATLTGYDADQVINNKSAWNDLIHPEAREYVWMTIHSAVQNQQPFQLTYRIITHDGSEKWVLEQGQGNFSSNGELLGLEGLITDITDNKRQSLRIERDTLFDPLTNLATPHLFLNRIQHAIELNKDQPNHSFSVVAIHINQQTNTNCGLGTEDNDKLAKEIGKRVKNILESSASVCRLRDDEYGILLEHCASSSHLSIRRTVRSILDCLKAPIKLGQNVLYANPSIGVAQVASHTSNSAILHDANRAMLQAKELGGSKIEFSDPQQNNHMTTVLGTESELRKALEEGELELVCQPIKSATSNSSPTQTLELKLAWHHARRGTLYADSFYKHIESLELIRLLGKLILTELPRQISANLPADSAAQVYLYGLGELVINGEMGKEIAEKLSLPQYSKLDFILDINAFQLQGLNPKLLKNLEYLQQQGIGIAVTDLKAGAPYADLLTLPGIKAIKICVAETPLSNERLNNCKAMIAYYRALNINVIAEGIDTPEISQAMEGTKVDYLQGSVISP